MTSELDAKKPTPHTIHLDHKKYQIKLEAMTGNQLRALSQPPIPDNYDLFLETCGPGDDKKVEDHELVGTFSCESFYSAPKHINPGAESLQILEEDEQYLKNKGYQYELTQELGGGCLIIKNFPVAADKFDKSVVELMLRLPQGYNNAALDNFYVSPEIKLKQNNQYPNQGDVFESHSGRSWQRFSRHFQAWRPGLDTIKTFMPIIIRELQGKA